MIKINLEKFFILIVLLGSVSYVQASDQVDGNINVLYGKKSLKTSDWEPLEKQDNFGVMLDVAAEYSPWYFSVDYFHSESDTKKIPYYYAYYLPPTMIDVKGETNEIAIGFRMYPKFPSLIKPYWGLAFSIFNADIITPFDTLNGSGPGVSATAGVLFRPIKGLNIGLNARYAYGNIDFGVDETIDAGGTTVNLVLGTNF